MHTRQPHALRHAHERDRARTLHLVPILPPVLDEPRLLVDDEVAGGGPLRPALRRRDAAVLRTDVRARCGVP